jgi:hypothetical protein
VFCSDLGFFSFSQSYKGGNFGSSRVKSEGILGRISSKCSHGLHVTILTPNADGWAFLSNDGSLGYLIVTLDSLEAQKKNGW